MPNVVWMKAVLYYVYILRGVEKLKPNWIDGFYTFEVTQLTMESNNIVVRMKESKYIKQCCIVCLNLKLNVAECVTVGKSQYPFIELKSWIHLIMYQRWGTSILKSNCYHLNIDMVWTIRAYWAHCIEASRAVKKGCVCKPLSFKLSRWNRYCGNVTTWGIFGGSSPTLFTLNSRLLNSILIICCHHYV